MNEEKRYEMLVATRADGSYLSQLVLRVDDQSINKPLAVPGPRKNSEIRQSRSESRVRYADESKQLHFLNQLDDEPEGTTWCITISENNNA